MRIKPYAVAGRALAFALLPFAGLSAIADDNCAPCAQARSQAVRLLAQPGPTPQGYPSGQYAGVPSCLGGTGPCWPSQYTGPCFPQIQPRWIQAPPSVNVTPQAQMLGASAPCQPCQNYPSFYCPPTLAPARPAIPLQAAGRVPLARPVPYESLFPSSQILGSQQVSSQNPPAETVAPPETPAEAPSRSGEAPAQPEQP
ncbi:MAG: hypothetical protein U0800_22790 [Isosphaeraceae bacterium]